MRSQYNSSFIVRVKFMARPGEQFVLRREVFRRVQEAFKQSGIKFAPRRVIVDAPTTASAGTAAAVVGTQRATDRLGKRLSDSGAYADFCEGLWMPAGLAEGSAIKSNEFAEDEGA